VNTLEDMNQYECDSCKRKFKLIEMRYNPYEKVRMCKRCYEIYTKEEIVETYAERRNIDVRQNESLQTCDWNIW